MSVFHQMGHQSRNLIDLPEMAAYEGAIFSPINASQPEMSEEIRDVRSKRGPFEIIFDPQLYVPATKRGKLSGWSYFPKDVDTADLGSVKWWDSLNGKLASACAVLQADAVCSPAILPKVFDNNYYNATTQTASKLARSLEKKGPAVWQTLLVSLAGLTAPGRSLEIASIVSRTEASRIYLVLVSGTHPRRELGDGEEIVPAMRFISSLERAGLPVVVGFCSSDLILWKAAGATGCATGKFFNLRRFTRQRFEEVEPSGGGQLPYWFEEGLLAFLREGDLIRVRREGLISDASKSNPFCALILAALDLARKSGETPKAWLGLGWRQFLYWFADAEARLARREIAPDALLAKADTGWSRLDKARIYTEERENDGSWIRVWLNAIRDYADR